MLVGGLVTAPLPVSLWLSDLPLRGSLEGRMTGLVMGLAGLGMLAWAWIRLWQGAGRGVADLTLVRRLTAMWCLPLLAAPPLFSRDGWSYAAQGALPGFGVSPYERGPGVLRGPIVEAVDPQWLWTPAPYGPLPLLGGSLASEVTTHPWLLVLVHRGFAVGGLVLLAWALPRLSRWTGVDPVVVSALVLPSPLLLAHGIGGLHNDLLMVGLVAAALVVTTERGWVAGALLGGLAASVKVPGGLVCVAVALVSLPLTCSLTDRLRRLAGVALVSVAALVGVGVVAGTGVGWIHALGVPGRVDTPLSATSVLDQLIGGVVPGIEGAGVVLALALVAWLALRGPTGVRASAVQLAALALGISVVLSPVVHAWYFLWFLPLLAVCRLGPRGRAVLTWLSLVLGVAAPLDSSLEGMPVAITLTAIVVGGIVAGLSWSLRPSVLPATERPALSR